MLNYDDRMSNEQLKMNVQFRKIEPRKFSAHNNVTSTKSEFNQMITKPLKKQELSPNVIHFGKFPVQKLLRIPFEKCVRTFSKVEKIEDQIYIRFEMHKEWIDFIIRQILNRQGNTPDLMPNSEVSSDSLNVEVIEMDGQVMYRIGTILSSFYMTFSDRYPYVYVVCGVEYLKENHDAVINISTAKELKKGLLHYILNKWIN
jgi:hypothetical protein